MDDHYRNEAGNLLAYFRLVHDGRGERDRGHWQRAIQMCERWILLIGSSEVTNQMIESFLDDIYAEVKPGAGWYELSYQFKQWARYLGFAARDRTYAKP
jgi:hypothetical protein